MAGRPKLPESEKLSEPISFRLTQDEYDRLCIIAISQKVSLANIVRKAITKELQREEDKVTT
jgi:hypothetical protein